VRAAAKAAYKRELRAVVAERAGRDLGLQRLGRRVGQRRCLLAGHPRLPRPLVGGAPRDQLVEADNLRVETLNLGSCSAILATAGPDFPRSSPSRPTSGARSARLQRCRARLDLIFLGVNFF
jgi:hypothetical protein